MYVSQLASEAGVVLCRIPQPTVCGHSLMLLMVQATVMMPNDTL